MNHANSFTSGTKGFLEPGFDGVGWIGGLFNLVQRFLEGPRRISDHFLVADLSRSGPTGLGKAHWDHGYAQTSRMSDLPIHPWVVVAVVSYESDDDIRFGNFGAEMLFDAFGAVLAGVLGLENRLMVLHSTLLEPVGDLVAEVLVFIDIADEDLLFALHRNTPFFSMIVSPCVR